MAMRERRLRSSSQAWLLRYQHTLGSTDRVSAIGHGGEGARHGRPWCYSTLRAPHAKGNRLSDHPNEDVVRRAYEAFASGDMGTIRTLWTDDIVFHVKGLGELDGDYAGPDAVFGFFAKLSAETDGTFRLDVHTILADDEHSVTLLMQHAERRGRTLDSEVVHIGHMRDGKTSEFWAAVTDPGAAVAFWS